ncbi:MAG: NAD(P)H-hydrate dehydratase, partial [Zetaproteobacteria bacterium]
RVLTPAPIGILDEEIAEEGSRDPIRLVRPDALALAFPPRPWDAHKGDFGRVGVVGGARGTLGAPILAGYGAMAAGAGLVYLGLEKHLVPEAAGAHPALMIHPEDALPEADAYVVGCGWGRGARQKALLAALLERPAPLVLDADALRLLSEDSALADRLRARKASSVLTPHPGEAAALLGEASARAVQQDRVRAVRAIAARFGAIAVLKGAHTLIATPTGEVLLCPISAPQLAQGGTGDVLAGVIGALLARRAHPLSPPDAAAAAVWLHAEAGRRMRGLSPMELARTIAEMRRRAEGA